MYRAIQWNPSITDTIGTQHFVRYSEVSLTQGLPVYFRYCIIRLLSGSVFRAFLCCMLAGRAKQRLVLRVTALI